MLTNLAAVVRTSGLKVVEVAGWRTRGHGQMTSVEAIICHHTAGAPTGDYPSLGVVRDGRAGLAGPLSQLGLGRSGTVYVIAAGVCYHAGATFFTWQNNWHAIGIEAEATGTADWPSVQYNAYVRLCAALRHGYGVPNPRVLGHKEVAKPLGRKPDPNFNMDTFRRKVAEVYAGKSTTPTTTTPKELFTVSQFDDLIQEMKNQGDATRKEIREQAIWGLTYGLEIADDLEAAGKRFADKVEAGGSVADAQAEFTAAVSGIRANLKTRAADNEAGKV